MIWLFFLLVGVQWSSSPHQKYTSTAAAFVSANDIKNTIDVTDRSQTDTSFGGPTTDLPETNTVLPTMDSSPTTLSQPTDLPVQAEEAGRENRSPIRSGLLEDGEDEGSAEPEGEPEPDEHDEEDDGESDKTPPDNKRRYKNRQFIVQNENSERKVVGRFDIRTRKSVGLFVKGKAVTLRSQLHAIPMTIKMPLPSFNEAKDILETISMIQDDIENNINDPVLRQTNMPATTRQAIRSNLQTANAKANQLKEGVTVMRDYLKNTPEVNSLPESFSRYCTQTLTYNIESKLVDLKAKLDGLSTVEYAKIKPVATRKSMLYNFYEETFLILNMLETNLEYQTDFNRLLEELSRHQISSLLSLFMQKNPCIESAVEESYELESCVALSSELVCQISVIQQREEDRVYPVVAVTYPDFVSNFKGQYVQNIKSPNLYSKVTDCKPAEDNTILLCKNIVWKAIECFTFAISRNLEQMIEHCQLVRPETKQLQMTPVHQGILIDNKDVGASVRVEDQHTVEGTALIVPYSFSFTLTASDQSRSIKARLPFDLRKSVHISWFTEAQYTKLKKHVDSKHAKTFVSYLRSDEYEIFAFLIQVLAIPFLMRACYTVLNKQVISKYEIRKQRRRAAKSSGDTEMAEGQRKVWNSRRQRPGAKSGPSQASYGIESAPDQGLLNNQTY